MEFADQALPWQSVYKIMTGAIVPRPIGWISTVDAHGVPNLAPYSFFNAVCSNPPTLLFCPAIRAKDRERKDTLKNVIATGEFVVNIVTESLAEAMNLTSGEYPPEVSEFDAAGLTPAPSVAVRAPRVAESPIHFECKLDQIITIGETPGGASIVVGRVVHIHVADEVFIAPDKIDVRALKPIGRLAGTTYSRTQDLFDLKRPNV
ncbi:flavin reductase family protein [Aggregatilineales bacterium SYSU G02658]